MGIRLLKIFLCYRLLNSPCFHDLNDLFIILLCAIVVFSLIPSTHFLGGFALLPFLWFINVVWFFKEAFIRPSFSGQSKLKSCKCNHNIIMINDRI